MATLAVRGDFRRDCVPGPTSLTGGIDTWAEHPLRAFLEAGIPCCLNTDDRTLFGLDLEGEYGRAAELIDLTTPEHDGMQKAARQGGLR